jgi:hypothetical protein
MMAIFKMQEIQSGFINITTVGGSRKGGQTGSPDPMTYPGDYRVGQAGLMSFIFHLAVRLPLLGLFRQTHLPPGHGLGVAALFLLRFQNQRRHFGRAATVAQGHESELGRDGCRDSPVRKLSASTPTSMEVRPTMFSSGWPSGAAEYENGTGQTTKTEAGQAGPGIDRVFSITYTIRQIFHLFFNQNP